jgi:hypothetical protein
MTSKINSKPNKYVIAFLLFENDRKNPFNRHIFVKIISDSDSSSSRNTLVIFKNCAVRFEHDKKINLPPVIHTYAKKSYFFNFRGGARNF